MSKDKRCVWLCNVRTWSTGDAREQAVGVERAVVDNLCASAIKARRLLVRRVGLAAVGAKPREGGEKKSSK